MVDVNYITETLIDLVKINSINPALEAEGSGEWEVAHCIADKLQALGWDSSLEKISEGRCNVVCHIGGVASGKSLILNAHMDTVGVEGMRDPFAATIKDGKLYGRGAYDMKGSIAAILGVAKAIHDNKIQLPGSLILSFVADEEYESAGTTEFLKKYTADACIVTEPTDLDICLGHRGFGVYQISTEGVIAHGGLNQIGVDANLKMGKVLHEINIISEKLNARKHPLVGEASVHVPIINGGQSLFIYSGKCTIHVERRTLPGETENQVLHELQNMLDKIAREDRDFRSELKQIIWRNPYEISKDAPISKALISCIPSDHKASFIGHGWWEDSGLFGQAGIDTIIIGPKGGGIHQQVEWVELASVHQLSEILLKTYLEFCK